MNPLTREWISKAEGDFATVERKLRARKKPKYDAASKALGDSARAKGMSQVARDAGLSRESLYKALSSERSPDFAGGYGSLLRTQSNRSKSLS